MNVKPVTNAPAYQISESNSSAEKDRRRQGERPLQPQQKKKPEPNAIPETATPLPLAAEQSLPGQWIDSEKVVELLAHRPPLAPGLAKEFSRMSTVVKKSTVTPSPRKLNRLG
jgi:hypothetical protein